MTNHLENLKDGYARAKTDTERRAFLRAALRVMARNAHDLEECCLGLVGVIDARPSGACSFATGTITLSNKWGNVFTYGDRPANPDAFK